MHPLPTAGDAASPSKRSQPLRRTPAKQITEDAGGVPAHLLERSRKRKAALAGGGGGEAAPAASGGARAANRGRGAGADGTGPGGHTQRLLTVVKSGSIQQTRAEAQTRCTCGRTC